VNNWVTNCIDWLGGQVRVCQRTIVDLGRTFNHTWIDVVPDNPSDFISNSQFLDNGSYTTISGMPSGDGASGGSGSSGSSDGSYLNSAPNADAYYVPTDTLVLDTPSGMTDTQFIQALLDAQNNYTNDTLSYSAFYPSGDNYNSNSFASGMLTAVGLNGGFIIDNMPGAQPGAGNPVPTSNFLPE
jgi:hypothetical protein